MNKSNPKTGQPEIKNVKSFKNIVINFTDPREVMREAISNSLDWGANNINITVWKDKQRQGELVIQIRDDGKGLTPERFKAFWNLADSPEEQLDKLGRKMNERTGEKGYGTKTYWKCRELEVASVAKLSDGNYREVLGWMTEPLNTLTKEERVPGYQFVEANRNQATATFTEVTIRGFHTIGEEEFRHEVLKDYILWFTKFGSIEIEFGVPTHKNMLLSLQGLGAPQAETISFGHVFPSVSNNVKKLQEKYKGNWEKNYVNKWLFQAVDIKGYPNSKLDMVFYLEGDSAKRRCNDMLPAPGRARQYWRYSVMERYGVYVSKDYIPLPPTERINHWICPGRNEWTLYHAFVNCQDFQLTDNRTSIGATDRHFLSAVKDTIQDLFKSSIQGSPEYKAYQDEIDATNRRHRGETKETDEKEDIDKRFFHAKKKTVAEYKCSYRPTVILYEPRQEVEVLILFSTLKALTPDIFPFRIVDYSTSLGIDALCVLETGQGGLQKGNLRYVEFKKSLDSEFKNHTFSNLTAIVCWDCNLENGAKITDIANRERTLHIAKTAGHTTYTLIAPEEQALVPIRVYVLKEYLPENLNVSFEKQLKFE